MEYLPLPTDIINKIQLYVSTPEADMVRVVWNRRCCCCDYRCHPFQFYIEMLTTYADKGYPIICHECEPEVEAELDNIKIKAMKQFLRNKIKEDKIRLLEICRENDIPEFIGELGAHNFDGSHDDNPKYIEFCEYMKHDHKKIGEYAEELEELAVDEGIDRVVVGLANWSDDKLFEEISYHWISDNFDLWDDN